MSFDFRCVAKQRLLHKLCKSFVAAILLHYVIQKFISKFILQRYITKTITISFQRPISLQNKPIWVEVFKNGLSKIFDDSL